jgi:hypothetical protein
MTDDVEPAAKARPTKAERLEAKAARLREAEQRRAAAVSDPARPQPTRAVLVGAIALGAVVAVLAALLIVFVVAWANRGDEVRHARAAARREVAAAQRQADAVRAGSVVGNPAVAAAKAFALDFGSYDYRHLDQDFAEVARRMTPSFAKNYAQTSSDLKPTLEQYKTQVTARIQGYGLTSATRTSAVVVVFLDQTVRTSQSSTPRIDRNRLEIHLVRTNGKWLVAKLLAK